MQVQLSIILAPSCTEQQSMTLRSMLFVDKNYTTINIIPCVVNELETPGRWWAHLNSTFLL